MLAVESNSNARFTTLKTNTGIITVCSADGSNADAYGLALRGNSLLMADVSKLTAGAAGASLITLDGNKTALVEKSASIRMIANNIVGGKTYTLVSGLTSLEQVAGTELTTDTKLGLKDSTSTSLLLGIRNITYNITAGTITGTSYVTRP